MGSAGPRRLQCQCDPLPAMNRTVTLSLRNVSMRRHLVEFAATAAANLVQTLALQSESELQSGQVYPAG